MSAYTLFWHTRPDCSIKEEQERHYISHVYDGKEDEYCCSTNPQKEASGTCVKVQIMQERKDLAFTLKDTKTIVGKLRTILGIALHFVFIMFYLLIFAVGMH